MNNSQLHSGAQFWVLALTGCCCIWITAYWLGVPKTFTWFALMPDYLSLSSTFPVLHHHHISHCSSNLWSLLKYFISISSVISQGSCTSWVLHIWNPGHLHGDLQASCKSHYEPVIGSYQRSARNVVGFSYSPWMFAITGHVKLYNHMKMVPSSTWGKHISLFYRKRYCKPIIVSKEVTYRILTGLALSGKCIISGIAEYIS